MDKYAYEITLPYVDWNMPLKWIFQQTSKLPNEWFWVKVIVRAAQSPDLNPIERLWEEEKQLSNTEELWITVCDALKSLKTKVIQPNTKIAILI